VVAWIVRLLRDWRGGYPGRRAVLLGAVTTVLIIAQPLWAWTRYDEGPNLVVYLVAAFVVLMIAAVVGEDRPVPMAVARLSLILGFLLQVPLVFRVPAYHMELILGHVLLGVAAAGIALLAFRSAQRQAFAVTPRS
jgi:hypothetical protein